MVRRGESQGEIFVWGPLVSVCSLDSVLYVLQQTNTAGDHCVTSVIIINVDIKGWICKSCKCNQVHGFDFIGLFCVFVMCISPITCAHLNYVPPNIGLLLVVWYLYM